MYNNRYWHHHNGDFSWTSDNATGSYTGTYGTIQNTGYMLGVSDGRAIKLTNNIVALSGKTFTLTGLRTDLGFLTNDDNGVIHASNDSIIGRMTDTKIILYRNARRTIVTPQLTGTDAADFTLILQ